MKEKKQPNLYAQDGVNVNSGDALSKYAKQIAMGTYQNSPFIKVSSTEYFRGPTTIEFPNLPKGCKHIYIGADGNGTKPGLNQAVGTYHHAPHDFVAMVVDDAVRYGIMPLSVTSVLCVNSTGKSEVDPDATIVEKRNFNAIKMIYEGMKNASDKAGVVILGGETAEMGAYTGSEIPEELALRFSIEGTCMGVSHPEKIITGDSVKEGQIIIALRENGFRCNGISSVRKAFAMKYGNEWWMNPKAKEDLMQAATPSTIYSKLISGIHGWYNADFKPGVKIHAIAHITGGGIKSKLGDDILFKKNLSANLTGLWNPPTIMEKCRKWRDMTESGAYETWNGGQGMLLIIDNDEDSINYVISRAKAHNIDAKVCGKVCKWKNPRINIESKFSSKKTRLKFFKE